MGFHGKKYADLQAFDGSLVSDCHMEQFFFRYEGLFLQYACVFLYVHADTEMLCVHCPNF